MIQSLTTGEQKKLQNTSYNGKNLKTHGKKRKSYTQNSTFWSSFLAEQGKDLVVSLLRLRVPVMAWFDP